MEQLEQAKQTALRYVAARMHTTQEVRQLLQKKGYEDALIQNVIAFLKEYGYLDDAAYCRSWIHDRIQFHPCGRQKMVFELAKKITDRHLVQQSVESYFSEEDERKLARAAAMKKLDSSRTPLRGDQLRRFLYTRGYGVDIINQTLQDETIQKRIKQNGPEEYDDNNF